MYRNKFCSCVTLDASSGRYLPALAMNRRSSVSRLNCEELGDVGETEQSSEWVELIGWHAWYNGFILATAGNEFRMLNEPISKELKIRRWIVPSSKPATSTSMPLVKSLASNIASRDARVLKTSSLNVVSIQHFSQPN